MSKQFQAKKESLSIINKTFGPKTDRNDQSKDFQQLHKKYNELLDRTKALEKVYKFHKGIVQNISSGIVTIDFEGKISFINSAALRVLDYEYAEIQGTSIRNIFADSQEAAEIADELLVGQNMFESREVSLLTRTGKIIPIGFSTTLLQTDDPKYAGIIISFRDLTSVMAFRNQMERIDRLTTLGEVSAGIAHEIRNPLAGIKTSAQVLEESFSPNDFRSQLVHRIVREIDRSNELLKKFFNFARPGKPKQDFVDVHALIEGIYILLSSKMKKRGIRLNRVYAENLPRIYVDEHQIEQVMMNLMLNAMDAVDRKGEITITTRSWNHSENINDAKVLLEIADNGIGIKQENLEKIFNPFFTTKSEGVGLGLSISLRLIEENGGSIEVESKENIGTKFMLYLPLK